MKKFIMILLAGSMVLLVSCSGDNSSSINKTTESETTTTTRIDTSSSTSVASQTQQPTTKSLSAKIAALTNEDGTGEVYIGMKPEEVIVKLTETGIPFKEVELGVDFEDGSAYFFSSDDLREISFMETVRGLKVGDTAKRVKELYEDTRFVELNGGYMYVCKMSETMELTIAVEGNSETSKVEYISLAEIWNNPDNNAAR